MNDRTFMFALALYQARQVDRVMANAIVESAKARRITLEQATEALRILGRLTS